MQYIFGQSIVLSARITRNGRAQSSQDVTVKVLNALTGSVLLAEIALTEGGTPGFYGYNWESPPQQQLTCVAHYVWGREERNEVFNIVAPIPPEPQDIVGQLSAADVLTGQVVDETIAGVVFEQQAVSGEASPNTNLNAVVQDETIEGEIE